MNEQEETGVVKWFDTQKGYGFIVRANGTDIFVHATSITGKGEKALQEGERVAFVVGPGRKGVAAHQVRPIE